MTSEHNGAEPLNGGAAAAVLAAAIGCFVLGACALAADASPRLAHLLNVWNPTGPLSGVTTLAIGVWLVTWFVLARAWSGRNCQLGRINLLALTLTIVSLLITFPPFMDLLQGK